MQSLQKILPITKPMSILIVEDFDDLRLSIEEMLKKLFGITVCASDGVQALKAYEDYYAEHGKHFDIVLSDIQMPKMNGITLTEKIYDINSDQAIVILSAYQDVEYLMAFVNLGIERFLTKPIKHDQFIDVLYSISKNINSQNSKDTEQSNESPSVYYGEKGRYDRAEQQFFTDKIVVHLTKNERIFMGLLLQQPGKIYSNENIEQEFLAHDIRISNDSIRSLLSKLRKKLAPESIESIYSFGYRLNVMY